jgi:hypothetical protein
MKFVMGTEAMVYGSPLSPTAVAPTLILDELLSADSGVPELLLRSLRQEERYDLPEFDFAALSVTPLAASELAVLAFPVPLVVVASLNMEMAP